MSKRRRFRKKFKNMSIAKKALRKVNKLARTLKPEWKVYTPGLVSGSGTATGVINGLFEPAVGIDQFTRVGVKCRIMRMNVAYRWVKHPTPVDSTVRFIIYVDKRQAPDSKSAPLDVLSTVNPLSGMNTSRIKRYRILHDKVYVLSISDKTAVYHRFSKKLDFVIGFNGDLATDIESNGVYALLLSNEAVQFPGFEYDIRFYFTDV